MCSRSEKGGAGNSQDAYIDHCSQPRDDPCPAIGITVLPTRLQLLASRPAMMDRRVGTARPNSQKSIPPIPTFFPRLLALLYTFSLATHTFPPSISPQSPSLRATTDKFTAYFVAFGPHGPRAPLNAPGNGMRVTGGVIAALVAAFGIFSFARSQCEYFTFLCGV